MPEVKVTVKRDGVSFGEIVRPARVTPEGFLGVVYDGYVYTVNEAFSIDIGELKFSKSECPIASFEVSAESIPRQPIKFQTIKPTSLKWNVELNNYGTYFVFDGDEELLRTVRQKMELLGLTVRNSGKSWRPASDGYHYDWYVRVVNVADPGSTSQVLHKVAELVSVERPSTSRIIDSQVQDLDKTRQLIIGLAQKSGINIQSIAGSPDFLFNSVKEIIFTLIKSLNEGEKFRSLLVAEERRSAEVATRLSIAEDSARVLRRELSTLKQKTDFFQVRADFLDKENAKLRKLAKEGGAESGVISSLEQQIRDHLAWISLQADEIDKLLNERNKTDNDINALLEENQRIQSDIRVLTDKNREAEAMLSEARAEYDELKTRFEASRSKRATSNKTNLILALLSMQFECLHLDEESAICLIEEFWEPEAAFDILRELNKTAYQRINEQGRQVEKYKRIKIDQDTNLFEVDEHIHTGNSSHSNARMGRMLVQVNGGAEKNNVFIHIKDDDKGQRRYIERIITTLKQNKQFH